MHRQFRVIIIAGPAALAVGLLSGPVGADGLAIEEIRIATDAAGSRGLEALVVTPGTPGRHPLAIVSHGSPREADKRRGMSARGMLAQTMEFARRGFVAVSVLRRGYGSSAGGFAEGTESCDDPEYIKSGRAAAVDLRAAIGVLSQRPDVDPSQVLAVGVSAGGFATIALTADPPPGLKAAISFAGGRGSKHPDQVCREDRLIDAFGVFGRTSRVPMLWVYAENDHFFGPDLARRLDAAFVRAGGKVEFVMAPPFGDDGHHLFLARDHAAWTPIVDAFLARQKLGTTPVAAPRLAPPPGLDDQGRRSFADFLVGAPHKAFAVSEKGGYGWRTGRATIAESSNAALQTCEQASHRPCHLYAVDDSYAP